MRIYRIKLNGKIIFAKSSKNSEELIPIDKIISKNLQRKIDIKKANILPPIVPNRIFGIAQNYKGVGGRGVNKPIIFFKSPSSIVRNNINIKIPKFIIKNKLKFWGEPELGFIIKKRIPINSKINTKCIFGYLICNDITFSNKFNNDHHLPISKSIDKTFPISDFINTEFNLKGKNIYSIHNKKIHRRGVLDNMIYKPIEIIRILNKYFELNRGDLIMSGAPPRIKKRTYIKKNDSYECFIDELGSIKNLFCY